MKHKEGKKLQKRRKILHQRFQRRKTDGGEFTDCGRGSIARIGSGSDNCPLSRRGDECSGIYLGKGIPGNCNLPHGASGI